MMKVSGQLIDWAALADSLDEEVRAAGKRTAEAVPQDVRDKILSGTKPDGSPQKPTSDGSLPLYDTGRLADPRAYRIVERDDGWVIYPPSDRIQAIENLRSMGFGVFEVSKEIEETLERETEQALRESDPDRFTKKL